MYAQSERKRDLTGGIRFPLFGGIIDFIMLMLQWFVITVEVFLRRDFGERYLSKLNYVFGAVFLGVVALGTGLISTVLGRFGSWRGETSGAFEGFSRAMLIYWLLYLLAGGLHLLRIKWREAAGVPLHSLEWGSSWLAYIPIGKRTISIGGWVTALLNAILAPLMRAIGRTQKAAEQKKLPDDYVPLNDVNAVTERLIEPFVTMVLAFVLGAASGSLTLAIWLYFSAFALLITSSYRYYQFRDQILDIRDQMIESTSVKGIMQNDRMRPGRMRITGGAKATLKQMADELQEHPEEARQIMRDDSVITRALAAINPELQNLQQSNQSAYRPAITTTTGEALPENGQDAPPATPAATMPEEPNPATTPPEEEQPRE